MRSARIALSLMASGVLLSTGPSADTAAQAELPRRGFLGAAITPAEGGGVRVLRVIPSSTASALELKPEDVIRQVDGEAVTDVPQFLRLVGGHGSGESIRLSLQRGEESITREGPVAEFPRETPEHSVMLYEHARHPAGFRQRVLLTRPRAAAPEARVPLLFYIQGLGCGTIDQPFSSAESDATALLLKQLGEAGVATLRVEKPGIGDSEGPACGDVDFETELAGYRAALAAALGHDWIDPGRVVLFGHSMGGVMAPLVAEATPVRGIAAYGTILASFFEYLVENRRRQLPREELTPLAAEESTALYVEFLGRVLLNNATPEQVRKAHPHLGDAVPEATETQFFGRPIAFFHQLQALNTPRAWSRLADVRVLAMHGEFDWVAARHDHETIALLAGERGRFVELTGHDHAMTRHPDLKTSYTSYPNGELTAEVGTTLLGWMRDIEAVR